MTPTKLPKAQRLARAFPDPVLAARFALARLSGLASRDERQSRSAYPNFAPSPHRGFARPAAPVGWGATPAPETAMGGPAPVVPAPGVFVTPTGSMPARAMMGVPSRIGVVPACIKIEGPAGMIVPEIIRGRLGVALVAFVHAFLAPRRRRKRRRHGDCPRGGDDDGGAAQAQNLGVHGGHSHFPSFISPRYRTPDYNARDEPHTQALARWLRATLAESLSSKDGRCALPFGQGRASVRRSAATLVETDGRLGRSPGKFAFPSTPTHTRLARDGKGGANAQSCASRGHFVRLVGLFRFDLLARLEPPPSASVLKLERWPTTALRKRAARPNLPRMQSLTAHLLRHSSGVTLATCGREISMRLASWACEAEPLPVNSNFERDRR
jgi:hypothetical protein